MQQQRRGAHGFLCGVQISESNFFSQFCVLRPNPSARPTPILAATPLLQHEGATMLNRRGVTAPIVRPRLRSSEPYLLSCSLVQYWYVPLTLAFLFADQSPHRSSAPRWCHPRPAPFRQHTERSPPNPHFQVTTSAHQHQVPQTKLAQKSKQAPSQVSQPPAPVSAVHAQHEEELALFVGIQIGLLSPPPALCVSPALPMPPHAPHPPVRLMFASPTTRR